MRIRPLLPPSEEELRSRRVHELIRDYPELLPFLAAHGVDAGKDGGRTLPEILPSDGAWMEEVRGVVRWRQVPED